MARIAIPGSASDITPAWLTSVLQSSGAIHSANVIDCETNAIGEGVGFVGQLLRVKISYDTMEREAPTSLVAKLPSTNPQNDRYWGQPGRNAHEKEIGFYKNLAPGIELRTPRCFFGDASWENRLSVILLEDLSRVRPGDQLEGCPAEDAETVVRDWAHFNAAFWDNERLRQIPNLPGYTAGFDNLQTRFDNAWQGYVENFRDELPVEILQIGNRLQGDGGKSVRFRLGQSPNTLCHGDFRLDNLFFLDAESRIAVIDWSGYRSGPGVWDVSHFISQGLDPEIRTSCEHELLRIYHKTLVENGVQGYSLDQVRYDYRLSMLTHLQKLIRGASFDIVNDRHQRLTQVIRRRVSSAVIDNYGDDLVNS